MQQIRRRISASTLQEEKLNAIAHREGDVHSHSIQTANSADPSDVERLRRERNKLHARKTRVRKKKLVHEMERIVLELEEEVEILRSRSAPVVDKKEGGNIVGLSDMSTGEISAGEMGANVLASSFNRAIVKREEEKSE